MTELKGLLGNDGSGGSDTKRWGWTRCAVLVATLVAATLTIGLMLAKHVRGAKDWASGLIAFLPLVTAELVLGIPRVLRHMVDRTSSWGSNRAWGVAIPMAAVWALSGAIQGRGSALSCVFVVFLLAGVLGACIEQHGAKLLCFTDILVWVALAAPLDLRWVDDAFWYGPDGQAYDWWAIAISVVLVIGFAGTREEAFYRLVPRLRDFGVYLACLAGVLLTVVPIGLGMKFLTFPPTKSPTVGGFIGTFFGNVVAVAIVEELLFRCLLYQGLQRRLPEKQWWVALLLSSLLFGLWHWPREAFWDQRGPYMLLAFISGCWYCLAFKFSGNNILAAVLVHSTTDTLWGEVLK